MDMNKSSFIISFSGKESIDLAVLSKSTNYLLNVLNKIDAYISNTKYYYNVSYTNNNGFSLVITKDTKDDNYRDETNSFNVLLDIFEIRKFVCLSSTFIPHIENNEVVINNGNEEEHFSKNSYEIYTSDNVIEDNLSKLSSIIITKKNSFQCSYKNGYIERRVNYSREDLNNTKNKINLEAIFLSKEEYVTSMSLKVEQLDLSANTSWKFRDVSNSAINFKAKILDQDFINQLKTGNVIIGYGLILKSDVKMTIYKDKFGKIITNKSNYEVNKVHDVVYSEQVDALNLNI